MILDTSAIVEVADRGGRWHREVVHALRGHSGKLTVPVAVVGEAGYMLQARVGPAGADAFLTRLADGLFRVSWEPEDARLAQRILRDRPRAGMTDVLVAACSIRLKEPVLTLDLEDFVPLSASFGFELVALDH